MQAFSGVSESTNSRARARLCCFGLYPVDPGAGDISILSGTCGKRQKNDQRDTNSGQGSCQTAPLSASRYVMNAANVLTRGETERMRWDSWP